MTYSTCAIFPSGEDHRGEQHQAGDETSAASLKKSSRPPVGEESLAKLGRHRQPCTGMNPAWSKMVGAARPVSLQGAMRHPKHIPQTELKECAELAPLLSVWRLRCMGLGSVATFLESTYSGCQRDVRLGFVEEDRITLSNHKKKHTVH